MNHVSEIVIKTSPIVFIKRLIVIEFVWAFLTGIFSSAIVSLRIDLPEAYQDYGLTQFSSFNIALGLLITSIQILIVAVAFLMWYFDNYRVDREQVIHQRGNLFGVSNIVNTQTLFKVKVNQTKMGDRFNYGTLQLVTLDKQHIQLKNIPDPKHYADLIQSLIAPKPVNHNLQLQSSIPEMIAAGEGQYIEFKSSFSWDYRRQRINKDLYKAVMKNIVGFMNTTGGAILMGVDDEGGLLGLEIEIQSLGKPNVDGFENILTMAFNKMVGVEYSNYLTVAFEVIEDKTICRVLVLPTPQPVYLNHKDKEEFYIRTGNSSQPLTLSKAINYIQTHFEH